MNIWNEHKDKITTSRLEVTVDGMRNYREANGNVYLGYFEGRLLGFVNVLDEEDGLHISQIAVASGMKGQDIGSRLVQWIIEMANEQDKNGLRTAVQMSNIAALNFFQSHGFVLHGYEVELEYVPSDLDVDSLQMTNLRDREEFLRLIDYQLHLDIRGK